jgi:hypothetical protein
MFTIASEEEEEEKVRNSPAAGDFFRKLLVSAM